MQAVSLKVGQDDLLKKSILLLKSWMTYDGNLLGSHAANMATYALYIQVIFLLNNFSDQLLTPLDVFRKYFSFFATFDWERQMLSIYGPVSAHNVCDRSRVQSEIDIEKLAIAERVKHPELNGRELLFRPEEMLDRQINYAAIRILTTNAPKSGEPTEISVEQLVARADQPFLKKNWNLKPVNLVDPCYSTNNLGKSISLFNSFRFKEAIKLQASKLSVISDQVSGNTITGE